MTPGARGRLRDRVLPDVISIFIGTSAWLAWSLIRHHGDIAMLIGPVYRLLASLNIAAGLLMIGLFVVAQYSLVLILSTVGLGQGTVMWRLVRLPSRSCSPSSPTIRSRKLVLNERAGLRPAW